MPRAFGIALTATLLACSAATPGLRDRPVAAAETEMDNTVSGSYLVGRFALDRGDVATAADYLQKALEAEPGDLDLRRQVFVLELASGDMAAARGQALELVRLDADSEDAKLLLALQQAQAGQWAAADADFEKLGARGVASVIAPVLRAWSKVGAGSVDDGLAILNRQNRADDGFAPLRSYHRAMILAQSGRTPQALERLRELVTPGEPAPQRVVLALASVAAGGGDREGALKLLNDQLAILGEVESLEMARAEIVAGRPLPLPVATPAAGMADAMLGMAAALQEQRITGQALVYARLAAMMAPEDGEVWLLIGRIAQLQDNPSVALDAFSKVPAGSPQALDAMLARADALRQLGRTDESIAALREIAAAEPERTEALVALGDMLRGLDRYAEAEQAYSDALARTPAMDRRQWRLLYARGIAYERTQRWPQAEADFLKALELEPDQPLVLNYLGYSWVDQGINLERGQAMLRKAVDLRPEDGFIVDSLGWAYFRVGDYDRAVAYLERSIELEPGDPTINDHLGDAYWRVGREREARFQWQRALSLKPEQGAIAGIEQKIQEGLPAAPPRRG